MQLLKQYQPHAAGFNGDGLMPSPVKWCGTESGYPSAPIWSTGCGAPAGDPTASDYCPTGVDTYLQVGPLLLGQRWDVVRAVQHRPLRRLASSGARVVLARDLSSAAAERDD